MTESRPPDSHSRMTGPVRRVGVVGREGAPELLGVVEALVAFAERHGWELVPEEAIAVGPLHGLEALDDSTTGLDLLLSLGGDGTLLRGARMVASQGTPILGVNLGRLGFLTSLGSDEMVHGLERVAAGEALLDSRSTVEGRVVHADGTAGARLWALNDLVLHKGGVARVVRLDLGIGHDGARQEVGSFSGDGLIVATPTGSTAYSLSAGGPITTPEMECLVVTPISPHTMAMRPLVLPADETLVIHALDRAAELVVTADGQDAIALETGDQVVVEKGTERVKLVRFAGQAFFDTLRRKLNWAI